MTTDIVNIQKMLRYSLLVRKGILNTFTVK